MTEEEKQARADNCTPLDYANLAETAAGNIMELYSILSRIPQDKLREFTNAKSDTGQTVWAMIAFMNVTTMDIRRFTLGLGS